MAWMRAYDIDTPDGSVDDPAEAADRMNEIKLATQEREDVDHYWPLTGSEVSDTDAGEHRKITLRTLTAVLVAALTATKAYLYRLVTDGELYFKDDDDNTIKLTSGGKIPSASLDMKDEDNLVSDSATHTATQQSIKAYADAVAAVAAAALTSEIDDRVGTAGDASPASVGAATVSVTQPNGLVIKFGVESVASLALDEVTYATPFPNACLQAFCTYKHTGFSSTYAATCMPKVGSEATKLQIQNRSGTIRNIAWFAIGY